MFCGECGAKNKSSDAFCQECGAPLKQEETKQDVEEVVVEKKTRQPMSKKNKTIFIFVLIIAVVLGIGYKVGSDLTNPKKVAEEYIKALLNKDGNKLYQYLELEGDKTFVTKKIFTDVVKEKLKTNDVENYTITDVTYGDGKLSAVVKFKYTTKGSSSEKSSSVSLTKQKGKKYFVFDDWKVKDSGATSTVVDDYTIKVTKGSTLTYSGIKVSDKYKDKEESTDTLDVYVLPHVFASKTTLKAVLPSSLEIEEEVTPSKYYNTHTVSFNKNSLSDKVKDKIITAGKNTLTKIYNNAISSKEWNDVKGEFAKDVDLSKLESNYTTLVSNLSTASNKLTSIEFTTASIYDIDLDKDGYLEVKFKVNYNYSVSYKTWSDEEKTSSRSDYDYMTVTFVYDKGDYKAVNATGLDYYFYR